MTVPPPPPGWYPDPTGQPGQRYWDGSQWTDQAAGSAPNAKTPTNRHAIWVIAGASAAVVALVVVFRLVLGGLGQDESASAPVIRPPVAAPPPNAAGGHVSEATWTDGPWPLTVSEGTLGCEPSGVPLEMVTLTAGDTTYILNAIGPNTRGYEDIDAIWRDDPANPGLKVSIVPLLQRGLELC